MVERYNPGNTTKGILANRNTFKSIATRSRNNILPSQDCSGFLYILSLNPTLDALDPNTIVNMTITLKIVNNTDDTTTTYTDGTDYDMDYYNDELIYGLWIDHTFTDGDYTIIYRVDGDNIDPTDVFTRLSIACDCCLKKAIKNYISKTCCDCDEEFRTKFIKAYALSKAVEISPRHTNPAMLARAICLKKDLCSNLCKCKNC